MNTEITPAFANPLLCDVKKDVALEKPILFSTPMVKAILSGEKTMTRRIIGMSEYDFVRIVNEAEVVNEKTDEDEKKIFGTIAEFQQDDWEGYFVKCPYGNVGDYLWVRETFMKWDYENGKKKYVYKANFAENIELNKKQFKWKPSLFMPKEACRLWLKIVGIKVEKVQDISEEDAIREGIKFLNVGKHIDYKNPITYFEELWISINGKKSWSENNFVWVVEFERAARPF